MFCGRYREWPSNGFWEALGFEYRWISDDPEDLSYETRNEMVKGVNGTPILAPVYVAPEYDDPYALTH